MAQAEFVVQRNIAAATTPDGPTNTRIAMVHVKLPDGGMTQIAIREDELRFECGGDPMKEDAFIRQVILETMLTEFPGMALIRGGPKPN